MNAGTLISRVLDVAEAAKPLLGPGGDLAVTLGVAVVGLIDEVVGDGANVTPQEEQDLDAQRHQIEAAINQRIDRTVARLRGG